MKIAQYSSQPSSYTPHLPSPKAPNSPNHRILPSASTRISPIPTSPNYPHPLSPRSTRAKGSSHAPFYRGEHEEETRRQHQARSRKDSSNPSKEERSCIPRGDFRDTGRGGSTGYYGSAICSSYTRRSRETRYHPITVCSRSSGNAPGSYMCAYTHTRVGYRSYLSWKMEAAALACGLIARERRPGTFSRTSCFPEKFHRYDTFSMSIWRIHTFVCYFSVVWVCF